jgi:uncharacterized protein (TIGR03435 family)
VLAQQPTFTVASIKPALEPPGFGIAPRSTENRITWTNAPLPVVVLYAYDIPSARFSGNVPFEIYNIEAIADAPPTGDQLRLMFRALLEDRFGIKVHTETKERDLFRLSIARSGSKLRPAIEDSVVNVDERPLRPGFHGVLASRDGAHLAGKGVSFQQLVADLSGAIGRPILDQTGIMGMFDYDVRFRHDSDLTNENGNPYIGAAIENILGLHVESGRGPVEILVLDHIEKPSEN